MRISLSSVALVALAAVVPACSVAQEEAVERGESSIVDVEHTPVERQSIGNCWLYAEATWVESMHLAATGNTLDVSQSYWTYWHWFEQIRGGWSDEISTGGWQSTAHDLARTRGVVNEADFVSADLASESSAAQAAALALVNIELKTGRLKDRAARQDGALVRQVMDEAWGVPADVQTWMTSAFGADGSRSGPAATLEGSPITPASSLAVRYTERSGDTSVVRDTNLAAAIGSWQTVSYGWNEPGRRATLRRVQRALHDRQPIIITWNVDFNALESRADDPRRGSFNLATLERMGGPGKQGGHMTVLEDYEAETLEHGPLKAGVTLDPVQAADKLAAALLDSSKVTLLRMKNSWGTDRPDRGMVPGFPGYHDMTIDYANGPIAWCPDREPGGPCTGEAQPLRSFMLPPGY